MRENKLKSPFQSYQEHIRSGTMQPDPEQESVVQKLESLYQALIEPQTFFQKIKLTASKKVHGLYLWGSVGTGKTFLIDTFFHALPFDKKLRLHFHAFMQVVHAELHVHKGKQNPLEFVAKEFSSKAKVLCLDELIVNDITDAMLLTGLFKHLYEQGVCILFTSNITPDRLYEKGLQRQQFLPAIALIKTHSSIIELNTKKDYRQQYKQHSFNFYTPPNDEGLEERFKKLATGETTDKPITIHGREINVIKRSDNCIWFDFKTICSVPRSQKDYLTIAKQYPNIIVSDLLAINAEQNNLIRSFIHLIDVFYDQKILLILSSEKPIHEIYTEGRFLFPFARTQSRITEMQAENWMAD